VPPLPEDGAALPPPVELPLDAAWPLPVEVPEPELAEPDPFAVPFVDPAAAASCGLKILPVLGAAGPKKVCDWPWLLWVPVPPLPCGGAADDEPGG